MQEWTSWSNIVTNLLMSLEDGKKTFDSVIAMITLFVQLTCPLPLANWGPWSVSPAEAVLYSPETKIPRTGELALRRAIPANTNMKAIQVCYCLYFLYSS